MLTHFDGNLFVFGGLTGTPETTKDHLFSLNLKSKVWSRIDILDTGEQLSNFTFQTLEDSEVLIFGGQNFQK